MLGFFDSGVGGTTIWKEVNQILPNESTIFLADSKNAPYGTKTKQEIIDLCRKNTDFLLQHHTKMIIVACNTATTNAIDFLREHYSVPFVGIEPAIKPASLQTKTKKIGVLATRGTLASELFHKTKGVFATEKGVEIISQQGDGLVELIEENKIDTPEMCFLLQKYLTPMVQANVDYIVLGCTHYPYLRQMIESLIPENIIVMDSGRAVAQRVRHLLEEKNLFQKENEPVKHTWVSTKNIEILKKFAPVQLENFQFVNLQM